MQPARRATKSVSLQKAEADLRRQNARQRCGSTFQAKDLCVRDSIARCWAILFLLVLGGTKLKLDDPQVEHLRRAQELVAKAYAEVLAANMPVCSASPAIMNSLLSTRNQLKTLIKQASEE
jgi:hypothetical protein